MKKQKEKCEICKKDSNDYKLTLELVNTNKKTKKPSKTEPFCIIKYESLCSSCFILLSNMTNKDFIKLIKDYISK